MLGSDLWSRAEDSDFIFLMHRVLKKMAGYKSWSRISGSRFRISDLTDCFLINVRSFESLGKDAHTSAEREIERARERARKSERQIYIYIYI